jgi:hypothetical protein
MPLSISICSFIRELSRPAHWIADAHRGDGKRYVGRADEKLTAFLELERAIYDFALDSIS